MVFSQSSLKGLSLLSELLSPYEDALLGVVLVTEMPDLSLSVELLLPCVGELDDHRKNKGARYWRGVCRREDGRRVVEALRRARDAEAEVAEVAEDCKDVRESLEGCFVNLESYPQA